MQLSFAEIVEPPKARARDPKTSHEAAAMAKELQAAHGKLIVSTLKRFGPSGVDRIASLTRLSSYQVSKRMKELAQAGQIEETGETVKSLAGRAQREWKACA